MKEYVVRFLLDIVEKGSCGSKLPDIFIGVRGNSATASILKYVFSMKSLKVANSVTADLNGENPS